MVPHDKSPVSLRHEFRTSPKVMMRNHRRPGRFLVGFVLGVLPIPLGLIIPAPVSVMHGLVELLTTPGVLITLPFHNAMPGGGWGVMALISLANGLVYGFVTWLVVVKSVKGERR